MPDTQTNNSLAPPEQSVPRSAPQVRQLLFFGEDWGRHPSTAQYLAAHLLDDFNVTWINSIGLREPSLSIADLNRVIGKLQRALAPASQAQAPAAKTEAPAAEMAKSDPTAAMPYPPHLVSPWIIPWHRFGAAQTVNQRLFKRQIAQQAHLHDAPYSVVTANPASYYLLDTLTPQSSLYYCADKYAHIAGLNPALVERFERELLERVDTVVATSLPLVDDLARHHANVNYLPHGVDFARFNSALDTATTATDRTTSESAATGAEAAKPVIGFVGLLGEHIDFELIKACAEALHDAHFLFVGPVEQGITLPRAANIEYVGQVDQSALPGYLRRMDLCTLPYAISQRNHYANPTKVREYLAAGRGVVATRQPGLLDIKGDLSVADTTQDYIAALRARLHELPPANSGALRRKRQAIAAAMQNDTWAARAAALKALISQSPQFTKVP